MSRKMFVHSTAPPPHFQQIPTIPTPAPPPTPRDDGQREDGNHGGSAQSRYQGTNHVKSHRIHRSEDLVEALMSRPIRLLLDAVTEERAGPGSSPLHPTVQS
jgi:hypothetical protein